MFGAIGSNLNRKHFEFVEILPSEQPNLSQVCIREVDRNSTSPSSLEWIPCTVALSILNSLGAKWLALLLKNRVIELSPYSLALKSEKQLANVEFFFNNPKNPSPMEIYREKTLGCLHGMTLKVNKRENDGDVKEPLYQFACDLFSLKYHKRTYTPQTPEEFLRHIAWCITYQINPYPKNEFKITSANINYIFDELFDEPVFRCEEKTQGVINTLQEYVQSVAKNNTIALKKVENLCALYRKVQFPVFHYKNDFELFLELNVTTVKTMNTFYLYMTPTLDPVRFLVEKR